MDRGKTSIRKKRAIETRKKIYKTAEQLFKQYGFENVSVDSIVDTAGVSKGAFYVHFKSKDALTADLINDYVNKLDFDYKSFIESFHDNTAAPEILNSFIERIAHVITCSIGFEHIRTVYKVQITKTVNTASVLDYNRELYRIFCQIIRMGVKQGEFATEIPVDTIARHFVMAIRGLTYEWCIRYPDFDLKAQALRHFEILMEGIKKH